MLNRLLAKLRIINIWLGIKNVSKKIMNQSRQKALGEEENMRETEFGF